MKTRIRQGNLARENNPTKTAQAVSPTVKEIRQRAQEIFLARGGDRGNDLDGWLRAEQQLKKGGWWLDGKLTEPDKHKPRKAL
jgi:hypothetical protein